MKRVESPPFSKYLVQYLIAAVGSEEVIGDTSTVPPFGEQVRQIFCQS